MNNNAKVFKYSLKKLIVRYPLILASILIQVVIRALILLPAIYAIKHINVPNIYLLFILSTMIWLFLVLPLRSSFCETLYSTACGDKFNFMNTLSLNNYFEKLGVSCAWFLRNLLWFLPLLAFIGIFVYYYSGGTDFITMSNFIREIGKKFYGQAGDVVEGGQVLLIVFALLLLFAIIGIVRNSAYIYLKMSDIRNCAKPKAELRRTMVNNRIKQILLALLNLAIVLPIVFFIINTFVSRYNAEKNLMMFLPSLKESYFYQPIQIFVGIWYMLTLPLRKIINASFASNCRYIRKNEKNKA